MGARGGGGGRREAPLHDKMAQVTLRGHTGQAPAHLPQPPHSHMAS